MQEGSARAEGVFGVSTRVDRWVTNMKLKLIRVAIGPTMRTEGLRRDKDSRRPRR